MVPKTRIGKRSKSIIFIIATLVLSACGSGLDGTYSDKMGVIEYKFESSGKVYASAIGMETELEYTVEGNKVKITVPGGKGGNQILTLQDDGSLSGPMGITLTKKD